MKTIIRPLIAAFAAFLTTFTAQAQTAPVTIYGHEYTQSANMALTVMKPDELNVSRVKITSGDKSVTVKTPKWTDPAATSESEEAVVIVALKKLDFAGPVVVSLLDGKKVIKTYRLDKRSAYGRDFLDFYTEF